MSSPPSEQNPFPRPLVDAWRAARPIGPELQRGYSRFLRRSKPRRRSSTFGRWLLGGVLLGAGLAQAATSQPWRAWTRSTEIEQPAPSKPAREPTKASSITPQPSLPITASPEPVSAPSPEAPQPPVARKAGSSAALAPITSPSAASFHVQEQWRLAAEGLRTGNGGQAERALLDLERTARGGEREAAQLARAQLLSRNGRSGEALRLASELERSASSSVVRDKARELTQSLSKNADAGRSRDDAAVINQP
jgi:hypothetical protein